ncbi:hypothetical protein CTAYLR_002943 [Chrysophaeum taylorii]|uniref:Uncharacterized protein n=1 Tax=Chrysophaeum taylorii TaxID=2483200 RepID=A0AAD7XR23_9STRA|nr:hypothetical protein CTAYLR_002943 [Chrysophaeum taylorii]
MALTITEKLPERYEERMLSASIDCDGGKGSGDACHAVGEYFSVIRSDHVRARQVYAQNCDDRGHAASCFNLGRLLLGGKGGSEDDAAAATRFLSGCNLGHAAACHHYGIMALQRGESEKGMKFLARACEQKEPSSCYLVGSRLLRPKSDDDRPRDVLRAKKYLEIACDEGNGPACHNLAVMFKRGDEGVPKDDRLFEKYAARTRELVEAAGATQGIRIA